RGQGELVDGGIEREHLAACRAQRRPQSEIGRYGGGEQDDALDSHGGQLLRSGQDQAGPPALADEVDEPLRIFRFYLPHVSGQLGRLAQAMLRVLQVFAHLAKAVAPIELLNFTRNAGVRQGPLRGADKKVQTAHAADQNDESSVRRHRRSSRGSWPSAAQIWMKAKAYNDHHDEMT